jgi:TetR/AcrR family transcriptional repressor of nem operon
MQQMIEMLAKQFHGVPPRTARKQAMAAMATMMGSLVMARIAGNSELSDEILKSGRDAILERAKPAPAKKSARKTAASA